MMSPAIMTFAKPYRLRLAVAGGLGLAEAGATLAFPWAAGHVAHHVMSGPAQIPTDLVLGLVGLLALQAVLRFASRFVATAVAADLLAHLRKHVFRHLQALPLSFHHRQRQGETLSLLTHDVTTLSGFVSGTLIQLAPLSLTAAGAIVLMLHVDPMLTALVAALVPVYYVFLKLAGRELRDLAQATRRVEARALAIADEDLRSLDVIKSFVREDDMSACYDRKVADLAQLSTRQGRINAAVAPLIELVTSAAAIILIAVASHRLAAGGLSTAETVSFFLYAVVLTRPVGRLASTYGQFQSFRGALARLEAVLTEGPEQRSGIPLVYRSTAPAVSFQNISFAYPGRPDVLTRFNLDIAPGETIALTGSNGSGKSTLAHLLVRLFDPDQGRILVDGQDIANLDLAAHRRRVGLVPQHMSLLNATVRENIAFLDTSRTWDDIQKAAQLAQAHDFIVSLPCGYDTVVGDNGVRLSGGQRQRIALARALLKDPPILILDEATAMFDLEGERSFIDEIRTAFVQRTVLLITHRPACLGLADRIIQMPRLAATIHHAAA